MITQLAKLESSEHPGAKLVRDLEALLRPFVLMDVQLDERANAVSTPGLAPPRLIQHGWRSFLVRVVNPYRIEARLVSLTPGVFGLIDQKSHAARTVLPDALDSVPRIKDAWLEAKLAAPADLSGLEVEYKVVSVYGREGGNRCGILVFVAAVEESPQSLSRSAEWQAASRMRMQTGQYGTSGAFEFDCAPPRDIRFDVREPDGSSCVAAITVRDTQGRSYPSKAIRLAPDMFFHEHVYRATGEVIRLPAGRYEISALRGPEYRKARLEVDIAAGTDTVAMQLDRWVDPAAARDHYSGDPHIHGGGCSHCCYESGPGNDDEHQGTDPRSLDQGGVHVRFAFGVSF